MQPVTWSQVRITVGTSAWHDAASPTSSGGQGSLQGPPPPPRNRRQRRAAKAQARRAR